MDNGVVKPVIEFAVTAVALNVVNAPVFGVVLPIGSGEANVLLIKFVNPTPEAVPVQIIDVAVIVDDDVVGDAVVVDDARQKDKDKVKDKDKENDKR